MEIEELRKRLREIQNMDSIEDLTDEVLLANFPSENLREAQAELDLGENENWARDIDMALGLERDKTQELSETVDYQRREELQREIANIRANRIATEERLRTSWLQKQRAQAQEARSQMKEEAKQDFITELSGIEADLQAKIQENTDNTNSQVETKKAEIAKLEGRIEKTAKKGIKILGIVEENKKVLALKKDRNSEVYKAAELESKEALARALKKSRDIKVMHSKIEELQAEILALEEQGKAQGEMLQQQLGDISAILNEIDITRQGLEEHEVEQEKVLTAEETKTQESTQAQPSYETEDEYDWEEEDELATEEQKQQEPVEPQQPNEPEQPKASEEPVNPNPVQPTVEKQKSQELTELQEPVEAQKLNEPKSSEQAKFQQTARTNTQSQPNDKKDNWKVESVAFTVEGGMQPVYKVIVSNGKEQKEFTSTEISVLDTEFDRGEITELAEGKKISQPEKYYDKGLATLLAQIDSELTTDSLEEYQAILRYPKRYVDKMKISYDFSGLLVRPTAEMKKLQKIANADSIKGVVSEFKGRPNFLTRLMKRIFTKSLPKESKIEMPKGQTSEKDFDDEKIEIPRRVQTSEKALDELGAQMKATSWKLSEDTIMKQWAIMHTEQGFDIEEFIDQNFVEDAKTSKEADEYRALQAKYEKELKESPQKTFRERVKKEAKGEGTPIVVDPKDISVQDKDGNTIMTLGNEDEIGG